MFTSFHKCHLTHRIPVQYGQRNKTSYYSSSRKLIRTEAYHDGDI